MTDIQRTIADNLRRNIGLHRDDPIPDDHLVSVYLWLTAGGMTGNEAERELEDLIWIRPGDEWADAVIAASADTRH
jgi:hypothetical protein